MPNILRATVRTNEPTGWWEVRLLDLKIGADGATEAEMLRQLEYALTAEYHLALEAGKTPFVELLNDPTMEKCQLWDEDDKSFRSLNLPEGVRVALSMVFRRPQLSQFQIVETRREAA